MDKEIVLDVETKKEFREVGRNNHHLLGVSVAVVFSYQDGKFHCFEEKQMAEMEKILSGASRIIGFNIKQFDFLVLKPYFPNLDIFSKPALDLMESVAKYVGYRPSLNSLVLATLNEGKSGSGMEALDLYRKGNMDDLKKYCQDDVRLTRDLYEYGLKNSKVFVKSRDGVQNHSVPVVWNFTPEAGSSSFNSSSNDSKNQTNSQISMF